jgi:hypothetical protein
MYSQPLPPPSAPSSTVSLVGQIRHTPTAMQSFSKVTPVRLLCLSIAYAIPTHTKETDP